MLNLTGKHVLVTDDSPTIRHYMKQLFTRVGANVMEASTGQEGIDFALRARPDLVVLDLLLPDMTGIEVLQGIREWNDECVIVMLTSQGGARSATTAMQRGADGYIAKEDVLSGDNTIFFFALQQAFESRGRIVSQKRLQAELAEKVEQLRISEQTAQEMTRAKSIFLANMSHELRTPLNAILGFIQLLERDPVLTSEQRKYLNIITQSGEHLLALINGVLSISKIEAGEVSVNRQAFDLTALLYSLEQIFRLRGQMKGLQIIFDVAPGIPPYVSGDDGKLRQVLINLLGNALKFTETGGIALRAKWDEGRAYFEVEDTGCGIDQSELDKLFEPFSQTQSGRAAQEGTGLGLAISRNFVSLMGGEITARSEIGKGTLFALEIELPIASETEARQKQRKVIGLEPGQPDFRILVVDDKWENREVLARLLQTVGFHVREASNGLEAIEIWSEWSPHLIWMDVRMSVIDGLAATQIIRDREKKHGLRSMSPLASAFQGTRIIALTASAFENDRDSIMNAGCDDFVAKPFRENTIFSKLNQYLGVKFVYEEEGVTTTTITAALREEALTPDRFAQLPVKLVIELREALNIGDIDATFQVIDQIEISDKDLSGTLRSLIRRYQLEEVLDVLERI
ncbi:MAG: response regulator [Blastocatellia bacterium]|nr:response regulator [Blastocatellia bacterium]